MEQKESSQESNGQDVPVGPISALFTAKTNRKMMERDAQLLANRINLLNLEEMKVRKKIEETKRKTQLLEQSRERNLKREQDMITRRMETEARIKAANTRIIRYREERNKERKRIGDSILSARQRDVIAVRSKSQDNQMKLKEIRDAEWENRKRKHNSVKQWKDEARQRLQSAKSERLIGYQNDYKNRVEQETTTRSQIESDVMKMEQLEAELISKLQNSQLTQKQAHDQLEGMVSQTSRSPNIKNVRPKITTFK